MDARGDCWRLRRCPRRLVSHVGSFYGANRNACRSDESAARRPFGYRLGGWVAFGRTCRAEGHSPGAKATRENQRAEAIWGAQGGVGPIRPEVGYEASESELAVYELPENRTLLLTEVIGALLRDQQIELDIANVPQVSVDAPLDEQEIESLLIRELDKGTSQSDLRTVAREAAAILGRGLPPERLAAAKREALADLKSGVYVLVESEWNVTSTVSKVALRLESLHPPNELSSRLPLVYKCQLELRWRRSYKSTS